MEVVQQREMVFNQDRLVVTHNKHVRYNVKQGSWKKYMNDQGDFEFAKYLYKSLTDQMKTNLDLGTLVCQDSVKLRAFKEQVKNANTQLWNDIAEVFEYFSVVQPCSCNTNDFCKLCGGSRYVTSDAMNADQIKEMALVVGSKNYDTDLAQKLKKGLEKALEEVKGLRDPNTYNERVWRSFSDGQS